MIDRPDMMDLHAARGRGAAGSPAAARELRGCGPKTAENGESSSKSADGKFAPAGKIAR
jgi:hypothetical protein